MASQFCFLNASANLQRLGGDVATLHRSMGNGRMLVSKSVLIVVGVVRACELSVEVLCLLLSEESPDFLEIFPFISNHG